MGDPSTFDTGTVIGYAVLIPVVSMFATAFMWGSWRLTKRALSMMFDERIDGVVSGQFLVVTSQFAQLKTQLEALTDENRKDHSEAMGRLDMQQRHLEQNDAALAQINSTLEQLNTFLAQLDAQHGALDVRVTTLEDASDDET